MTEWKIETDHKTQSDLLAYRLMTSLFLLEEVQVDTWVSQELKAASIVSVIMFQ